jgi:hypothetical protein
MTRKWMLALAAVAAIGLGVGGASMAEAGGRHGGHGGGHGHGHGHHGHHDDYHHHHHHDHYGYRGGYGYNYGRPSIYRSYYAPSPYYGSVYGGYGRTYSPGLRVSIGF